jgi:hypothetical protein
MIGSFFVEGGVAMSTQNAGAGNSQGESTSVGVGPANDARDGEGSQRATGGSGGPGLTRNLEDTGSGAPSDSAGEPTVGPDDVGEQLAEGTDMTATNRGVQDTRSRQAGSTETGLGAPETGANQGPDDLAPRR